jgi:hypothetical protein
MFAGVRDELAIGRDGRRGNGIFNIVEIKTASTVYFGRMGFYLREEKFKTDINKKYLLDWKK